MIASVLKFWQRVREAMQTKGSLIHRKCALYQYSFPFFQRYTVTEYDKMYTSSVKSISLALKIKDVYNDIA
jgi:hypothetical protein